MDINNKYFIHLMYFIYFIYIFLYLKLIHFYENNLYELNYIILVYPRIVRYIESQSFYINLISFPAQYFFHKIHVRINRAM